MIDYDYMGSLGEVISSIKIKTLFNGLNIDNELDSVKNKIAELNHGSDKVVWVPDGHSDVILKLAEGSQIKNIPIAFMNLFQPFYEYILPEPIEFQDVVFYRAQIQGLLKLPSDESKTYYPNNTIKIHASHKAIDKDFLWQLMETYNEDFIIGLCKWNMETGVSRSNWGLDNDGKPKIFDYGSVKNEKWREIELIQNGFYYEDGCIMGAIPE